MDIKPPKKLYKYRAFNYLTLDSLVSDSLYFAAPISFNDPLDTKPNILADLDVKQMENTLRKIMVKRMSTEMSDAAKTIKYRGPRTSEHIKNISVQSTEQLLSKLRYEAKNPDYEYTNNPHSYLLTNQLEKELIFRYGRGVVSLAERFSCPLMWSHYGDQHKGICIGYSIPEPTPNNLYKVQYGGNRYINASIISSMLDGDTEAEKLVDSAVLLRKAKDWKYEREWRLIGKQELADSPLILSDITFGLRCSNTIKFALIRALSRANNNISFYHIREVTGDFKFKRFLVNIDELESHYSNPSFYFNDFPDIADCYQPLPD